MKKDDERAKNRPERMPMHKQKILGYPERPGFTHYWANDVDVEIEAMKLAGWTPVIGNNDLSHDGLVQVESTLGTVVRRVVNKNPALAHHRCNILMEIPTEWYKLDQEAQQDLIDEKEKNLTERGHHTKPGKYGYFKNE